MHLRRLVTQIARLFIYRCGCRVSVECRVWSVKSPSNAEVSTRREANFQVKQTCRHISHTPPVRRRMLSPTWFFLSFFLCSRDFKNFQTSALEFIINELHSGFREVVFGVNERVHNKQISFLRTSHAFSPTEEKSKIIRKLQLLHLISVPSN